MKIFIKIIVICALCLFTQALFSEQLQMRGRQLAFLRNLPHRYLGYLHYSWMLQPHRTDYLFHYAIAWRIAVKERESLLEGMTIPTIPVLLCEAVQSWPNDEQLWNLSKLFVKEELREREERLLEESSNPTKQ